MSEKELFDKIDLAIESFKKTKAAQKNIRLSSKTQSDGWLTFNWRQMTWFENGVNYQIEIYPGFSGDEIAGWNLYSAAWYDENKKRYLQSKVFATNTTLDFIAGNCESLFLESYLYVSQIKKEQIPFRVDLK